MHIDAGDISTVLAGDIGGTHSRMATFAVEGGRLRRVTEEVYPSADHDGLTAIVSRFIKDHGVHAAHACFGIAGPVRNGEVQATNLPWVVNASRLAQETGLSRVTLINDLEAVAYSVDLLDPDDVAILNGGDPQATGNAAVIAAGTGLGESGLYWDGVRHRPFAGEGGHTDFAPADDLQDELLRALRAQYGHVSWERVVSGPGLLTLYRFLRDSGRGQESEALGRELKSGDASRRISESGLAGTDALCVQALDLFVSLYGREAGNLALKILARGGIYLAGGIAPQIIDKLRAPAFMQAFVGKGRMGDVLREMPVKVILNDKTGLLGAAHCAVLAAGT